jgi:hypothetical protein
MLHVHGILYSFTNLTKNNSYFNINTYVLVYDLSEITMVTLTAVLKKWFFITSHTNCNYSALVKPTLSLLKYSKETHS